MVNLVKNFLKDFEKINEYYIYLIEKTKKKRYVGITNEWLIDNFYLLVEHKTNLIHEKREIQKQLKCCDSIFQYLKDIVKRYNYNISFKLLVSELNKCQKQNNINFSYDEISSVKLCLLFLYTRRLALLCEDEYNILLNREKVARVIKNKEEKEISLDDFLDDNISIQEDADYIFEINNQLREIGAKSNKLFKELNELLKSNSLSLKEIINDCYQHRMDNDMLISNIFGDMKEFFDISIENLFKKVSRTEKLFLEDEIYAKMTVETKCLYRQQLLKLAKKHHKDELVYLQELFAKTDANLYHIGFQLFPKKKNTLKVILYILTIVIVSVAVSLLLCNYFLTSKILGFILLIIPVSQLFVQIFNQILMRFVPTYPLPKLDYSKGIPDDAKTMVVIPTIIDSKEKIKKMFDTLEIFYLINKTDNLYFTLLGDVTSSKEEMLKIDKELSMYGEYCAEQLNRKYKKNLFYFLYRKRFFNKHENCYLGYERKRGALFQFNQLLLKKMSKEEQDYWYFVNTFRDFSLDIKYVITLDQDNRLVLNTALNLVGAMAHPLNRPVLNKAGTKVINGYGIMQPRVSLDIEATNKSLYSQIFAGIGGFDTYSAIVPNVYQDTFLEGSFIGKGIYDLKVYDQVLADTFPDNLVLSHDLLEGNYLRCGYVCDIELIDDFPSKFLTDTSRQHRWARGDVQIIGWLLPFVRNKNGKKVKNPINLLGKWKIFDNIVRIFLYPMLLLVLLGAIFFGKTSPLWWILLVLLEIAVPVLLFVQSKIFYRENKKEKATVYYKHLLFGGKSLFLRSYIILATLPFYSKLYLDAFFRTIYRLLISHDNLLNWVTAEEAAKRVDKNFTSYLKHYTFHLGFSLLLLIFGIIFMNIYAVIFAFVFISAPFVLYYVSLDIDLNAKNLDDKEIAEVKEIAYLTWCYFKDNLKEEYHYLIPDNYQENREEKLDFRTSPTGIGFSMLSIVSAVSLEFISYDEGKELIKKILTTVESLKKWHGHLYNWYDIKTLKSMYPNFVSTVDSGNFVASLIVVREFFMSHGEKELIKVCDKLIHNTNFKKLYTKLDVFSIGYDELEGKLSIYNYNKFASESRLTSYLAICLGDVPSKHWFCLDKSLTTYKGRKGLISWSGTSFEYFMPLLFMKNYPNTLLDESYHFAKFCQEDYIDSVSRSLPWGISESAYNELDNSLNYRYQAFSTPYLKAKEDRENRIVIAPYASLMAISMFPKDVYRNFEKFKKLNMLGKYGFYESYDYDNTGVVKAFFAHHQGMSLVGLANYLKDGVIQNYFQQNVNIRTFDILLKEKVQVRTSIDMKIAKYKKYDYDKETIENDIRIFNKISYLPEVSVLSNKKYCLLMNDRGDSFSRYRTIQLNRYRKVTEQDYGIFLYIRDLDTNYIFSNTYAPINKKPEKYEVVFAADKIKYLRTDKKITTKTEIVVTKNHHAEIRKITFKNESDNIKRLELTTYTEPILSPNMDDVSHRVFNSMFLTTEYDYKSNSLIVRRKSRNDTNINSYMVHRLVIEEPLDEYSYETERINFLGRNRTMQDPLGIHRNLSNVAGTTLDPVLSIRNTIEILPNSSTTVYVITGFGRSREQIDDIIASYNDSYTIEKAFKVSTLMNIINTKNMNITGSDMRVYNMMLNYLYQTTRLSVTEARNELLRNNSLSQATLWKFGVSGDRPIVLVEIFDIADLAFVKEILTAFEYYKNNSIFVDIVIINSETAQYAKIVKKEIYDELYRIYTLNSFYHTPGAVTVINGDELSSDEKHLFYVAARLAFKIKDHHSLQEEIGALQQHNKVSNYEKVLVETHLEKMPLEKLTFDNGYGGFKKDGSEYVIYNQDTPTPWSNVIANKNFGTIVTNNGCGYTYAYNSSEFKITSWSNDMVANDKSEGFRFNGKTFDPMKCTHGFGYSVLESENEELKKEITEFVALEDTIKIYLVKLTNKLSEKMTIDVDFWINPVFGNFEEKTARHILTEFVDSDNYLKLRNVYSIAYSDVCVFMSTNLKITSFVNDKILIKSIQAQVTLNANEEVTGVFVLGSSMNSENIPNLLSKFTDVNKAKKELDLVKKHWQKTLNVVQVNSPDKSFNYMINGWYLYQALASRILARAGFYQVSGAFGYRDQLQDAMNITLVLENQAREQILINASHQFKEGDVLHWWHEINHFGLRSRYKDDYLWLVYATARYIEVTADYKILEEEIPYAVGPVLSNLEHEKGITFTYSEEKESLLEHCLKSLHLAMSSLGSHGLPLMGGGDWNDGMNKVGIRGKGESVWLGFFLYQVIDLFVKFMKVYDKKFDLREFKEFNSELKKNLNLAAWDGDYYLRAYFDNGDKLGSCENKECKIDLISQSFSILSEVIPKERISKVVAAVEDNLVDKDNNIIKLLTPPFENSIDNPGYIMNYPKGIRENGGQYTHATSWYIMALIKIGKYDLANKYYQMINPINRSLDSILVNKYAVEPYVVAADIYSAKRYPGRGGWTWYTGTAAWYYYVGVQEIIGLKKHGDVLTFKPNIPSSWEKLTVDYTYVETIYHIEMIKSKEVKVTLDGKKCDDGVLLVNDKKEHNVVVNYTK
ncbi:MAG TPA: hypothetical protein IAB45_01675 [Candidatus Onthousia faecavium]|nr:hypothetical protein [Candidatus Onthousia faecavium]